MKKKTKKLGLTRETITHLNSEALDLVAAQAGTNRNCCQESVLVCSIQHTCVSCVKTDTCA